MTATRTLAPRAVPVRARPGPAAPASGADDLGRRTVLRGLARVRTPQSPIDLARETHLSTLLVVPVLGQLLADSLVVRHHSGDEGPRHCWRYELTARGRRQAADR